MTGDKLLGLQKTALLHGLRAARSEAVEQVKKFLTNPDYTSTSQLTQYLSQASEALSDARQIHEEILKAEKA